MENVTIKELIDILKDFPSDLRINTEISLEWEYPDDLKKDYENMDSQLFAVKTRNNATGLNIYNGTWSKNNISKKQKLPIEFEDTSNADSRTAHEDLTMDDLLTATKIHIEEVGKCMDFFAEKIHNAGIVHDWTKLDNFEKEYAPLCLSRVVDDEFKSDPWYLRHIFTERHHINDDAKVDVNLIDVLEHISDVVSAGKGRSGHLTSKYIDIDTKLLYRCYWNTIKLLDDNTITKKQIK